MPLADAARRLDVSCGKRPAALPPAHGATPRLSGQTLDGPGERPRRHSPKAYLIVWCPPMKHLVAWLRRLRTTPDSELRPQITRVFHAGHLPQASFAPRLSIQPLGPVPFRPGDTGPESCSVLQFPDSLPVSEASMMLKEDLGALLCLISRRRIAAPLEIPISVKGTNTIHFLPYGGGLDRELIGPLPQDTVARLSQTLTGVQEINERDTAVLGAAMKLHYGACLLVERDVRSAYVLLVAALEVLSRSYGQPPQDWTTWEDSSTWDAVFVELGLTVQQQDVLRSKLLSNRQLRLKRTFTEYAANALPDDFWNLTWEQWSYTYHPQDSSWSEPVSSPIPVAEIVPRDVDVLSKAFARTYDVRSAYVHRGDEFDVAGSLKVSLPLSGDTPIPYQFLRLIVGQVILHEMHRVQTRQN